jgi:hypothetical protein
MVAVFVAVPAGQVKPFAGKGVFGPIHSLAGGSAGPRGGALPRVKGCGPTMRLDRLDRSRQRGRGISVRSFRAQAATRSLPKIPKVREHVEVKLADGAVMSGHVFIEATSRIQDLLNSDTQFIPFIGDDETLLLINKASIMQVRPFDA